MTADGEAAPAVSADRPEIPRTLVEVLERSAAESGTRIAIVDGDVRCTYDELRRLARSAADGFIAQGVRKGDRVALWLPNRLEWVVSFFGAIYAGAVVVTLNTALSVSEIEYQVDHAGASVLVVSAAYRKRDYRAEARQLRAAAAAGVVVVVDDRAGAGAGSQEAREAQEPEEGFVAFPELLGAPVQARLPEVAQATPSSCCTPRGPPAARRGRCTPTASSRRCTARPVSSGFPPMTAPCSTFRSSTSSPWPAA